MNGTFLPARRGKIISNNVAAFLIFSENQSTLMVFLYAMGSAW